VDDVVALHVAGVHDCRVLTVDVVVVVGIDTTQFISGTVDSFIWYKLSCPPLSGISLMRELSEGTVTFQIIAFQKLKLDETNETITVFVPTASTGD